MAGKNVKVFGSKITAAAAAEIQASVDNSPTREKITTEYISMVGEDYWKRLSAAERNLSVLTLTAVEEANAADAINLAEMHNTGSDDMARTMLRQIFALTNAANAGCPFAQHRMEELHEIVLEAMPMDLYQFVGG